MDIFGIGSEGAIRLGTYYYADRPRHGQWLDLSNMFPTGLRYPVLEGNRLYVGWLRRPADI